MLLARRLSTPSKNPMLDESYTIESLLQPARLDSGVVKEIAYFLSDKIYRVGITVKLVNAVS